MGSDAVFRFADAQSQFGINQRNKSGVAQSIFEKFKVLTRHKNVEAFPPRSLPNPGKSIRSRLFQRM